MHTFPEYFTGMHYAIKGYKFLFEPYAENFLLVELKKPELKNIQDKFKEILRKVIGEDNFFYLTRTTKNFKTGQPDLFIYNENIGDYFFAEVKFRDKLQEHQKKLIGLIGKRIPVKLVLVLPKQ